MAKLRLISEVLEEMRAANKRLQKDGSVRREIPKGSRWRQGDPGDPACPICEGTGYLRLDLPVGDRNFGKIFLCECTEAKRRP